MIPQRPPARNKDDPPSIAPPCSYEMEQSAIGAMLMLDATATNNGLSLLHPRHFYRMLHRHIFEAIRRIMARGETFDYAVVCEELRAMGIVRPDGETEDDGTGRYSSGKMQLYLIACIDGCPSSVNIGAYITVVIKKSKLRYQQLLSLRLQAETSDPDADPDFLHAAAQNALNAIHLHGWCDLDAIFRKGK